MDVVKEATNSINLILEMVGDEFIAIPEQGTIKQRLETLLFVYADKLIARNQEFKTFHNRRDIPEVAIYYLKNMIERYD
jgi:hypothetical protein